MKFIFSLTLLAVLSAMLFIPALGIAAAEPTGIYKLPEAGSEEGKVSDSAQGILDDITRIADWVFAIFLAISLIYIVIAAFQFITGGGDPAKVSEARQKLIYAAIGIAIALIVRGIPFIIKSIVV